MSPPGKGSELTGLTLLNFGILDSLPQLGTASARAGAGPPYPLKQKSSDLGSVWSRAVGCPDAAKWKYLKIKITAAVKKKTKTKLTAGPMMPRWTLGSFLCQSENRRGKTVLVIKILNFLISISD